KMDMRFDTRKIRSRYRAESLRAVSVHMERFNLKKLNEVEGKEQYHVEISNRFAALESLETDVDINKTWETIGENIKMSAKESLGYYEPKKHKPWFDEGCSKLLDQRKQAKLQWLQDPSELIGDNLNNIRRETSRHFRNLKRGYQPSSNLVKDENSDLLADSHSILNRWRNYFSQLLNVNRLMKRISVALRKADLMLSAPVYLGRASLREPL
ncbi:hypothetical protein B7P43_G06343, partial [Cryptotermes secundus]